MTPRFWVIGCGNPWRGDDAVGCLVAARVRSKGLPGVTVLNCRDPFEASPALTDATENSGKVVLVDALCGGHPPGTVYRLPMEALMREKPRYLSLHESPVPFFLQAAPLLFPDCAFIIIGIEPADYHFGIGLSPVVRGALSRAIAAVEAECLISSIDVGMNRFKKERRS